jgi:hypothetical protein
MGCPIGTPGKLLPKEEASHVPGVLVWVEKQVRRNRRTAGDELELGKENQGLSCFMPQCGCGPQLTESLEFLIRGH